MSRRSAGGRGLPRSRTLLGAAVAGLLVVVIGVAVALNAGRVPGTGGPPGSSALVAANVAAPDGSASNGSASAQASPAPPDPTPVATPAPSRAPSPSPTVSASPVRVAVDISLVADPKKVFASEATKYMCAASAMQMALNVIGPRVDTSVARQQAIYVQAAKYTTKADSQNGGWGPAGMAALLSHSGSQYRLVVYDTRAAALRASAIALATTRRPVILMAWWGAHAWVMTGIRADADPTLIPDFRMTGAYILDPWYPRVSTIWGRSAAPGAFHDMANLAHNFIGWLRPEGHYPGRDGKFLVILPVATTSGG